MIILALDLGITTGWALSHLTDGVVSGSFRCTGKDGHRYLNFVNLLNNLNGLAAGTDAVYYEQVRRHAGTDAAHVYGGFQAHLQAWCARSGVPVWGVSVGTIKKHATGRGWASKQAMIAAAVRAGHKPKDDNEADALALLFYAIQQTRNDR